MAKSEQVSLPYDMGNAGNLLKHGVMAEFLRTQFKWDRCVRLFDLFAGEPFNPHACERTVQRVEKLSGCALHEAQPDISSRQYYGSGMLARKLEERLNGRIEVIVGDCADSRRERLREYGLTLFEEKFPDLPNPNKYDAYKALDLIRDKTTDSDLILIDPFACFLRKHADNVLPQIEQLSGHSAVVLFALNLDPFNPVGRRFDSLLEKHLSGALIMTCPPICETKIRGEGRYYADVVLASPLLHEPHAKLEDFQARLEKFTLKLADTLELSERGRAMMMPRVIDRNHHIFRQTAAEKRSP